jgi:hypothetical protein
MFRIPSELFDMKQLKAFFVSDEIEYWPTKDKKSIIFDLNFCDEDLADWTEGEGWLDDLLSLREELIQGDFRVLYLAWLEAAVKALGDEEIKGDTLEPPVPYGLKELSSAQEMYTRFLDIDEAMIEVAAQQSEVQKDKGIEVEKWINKLSEDEKNEFLLKLSLGEKNLSAIFNNRIHELAKNEQPPTEKTRTKGRSISTLIELANEWHQQRKEKEQQREELAHKRRLELLATKKDKVWEEIYSLIEEKKSNPYDKAAKLLNEMHELAQYQNEWIVFRKHIEKIKTTYSRRTAFLQRMRDLKLID